jgi:hypothetical protein
MSFKDDLIHIYEIELREWYKKYPEKDYIPFEQWMKEHGYSND